MARDAKGRFVSGSAKSGEGIRWTETALIGNIDGFEEKLDRAMFAATELHANSAEAWAKSNAPWEDQTSNARNGLKADAVHEKFKHAIVIYHRVPYGIWLEVRWEGKYAIILPTVAHEGKEVMATLSGLFKAMR